MAQKPETKNQKYWREREEREAVSRAKYADGTHRRARRKYKKLYEQAYKDAKAIFEDFFNRLELYDLTLQNPDPNIPNSGRQNMAISELYRYNRYYEMMEELRQLANKLGANLLDTLDPEMKDLYLWTSKQISKDIGISTKQADEIAKTLYTTTGQNWQDSVWVGNQNATERVGNSMWRLQSRIEQGLMDVVVTGASRRKFNDMLHNSFGVSYSEADRLARTEISHIQNEASFNTYRRCGVEEYEYLCISELNGDKNKSRENVCDECAKLHKRKFRLDEKMTGVNAPPMHPHCRCNTRAVLNIPSLQQPSI